MKTIMINDNMRIQVVNDDITKQSDVQAIVNAANCSLLGGGGVDGAIHRAAGPELRNECRTLNGCKTGEAKITGAYNLPCEYVIHTVGPVYKNGKSLEPELLKMSYYNSLKVAASNGIRAIAFPAISTGVYGYPVREATDIAVKTVKQFFENNPDAFDLIRFVVFDDNTEKIYIDVLDKYIEEYENNKKSFTDRKVIGFHNPDEPYGFLSNWYMSDFYVYGKKFSSMEQYMMYSKALYFKDKENAENILSTNNVSKIKLYGRAVKNYNDHYWNGIRQIVVYKGLKAKFSQNISLREKLINTGDAVLCECAKTDTIWGVGKGMYDIDKYDMSTWKGQDLLGYTLMMVRDELK